MSQYGPPRAGQTFDLVDANAGSYPTYDPVTQSQLQYRWTLCYSIEAPLTVNPASGSAAPSWNPDPSGGWNPTPFPTPNQLWFNLRPEPGNGNVASPSSYKVSRNQAGISYFHLSTPLEAGERWYGQILVEQLRVGTGGALQQTGRWAASRGFWFGVVPSEY